MRGLLVVLFAFLALPAHAQSDRTVEDTVPLTADGSVSIETYHGSITIDSWDRAEVRYTAQITGLSDRVDKTDVRVDASDTRLRLETDYGDQRDAQRNRYNSDELPRVHYTLTVPEGARVGVEDYNSEIAITGLRAALDVETYKGPIDVTDQVGPLTVDTYKSDVELDGVNGSLEIDTYKGDVDARALQGGNVEVETYKGDIDLAFASLDGDVDTSTYKGRITLEMPEGTGFDLVADMGDRGDLNAPFDLSELRFGDEEGYRGPVNGGGPNVEFDTYKGSLDIRMQ